jgi:hypothetical protein
MNHEDAVELLDGFHRGTLDEQTMTELRAHLGECEECRALSRTYRVLHVSLTEGTDVADADHPSSDRIVAFAEDPNRLDPQQVRAIEDHVAACASCADEVEQTRRVAESLRRHPEPASPDAVREPAHRRPWSSWGALAAAVLLAAVAYPVYLGLFRLPYHRQQATASRSEAARLEAELERLQDWGGAVDLNVLPRTLRDGAEVATVTVEAEQPYAAIALELLLSRRVADEETLRFAIDNDESETIWKLDRRATEVRSDIATWGVVTLIVPLERMQSGRHTLDVLRIDRPGEDPLLRVPFDLQRQSPAATNAPQ